MRPNHPFSARSRWLSASAGCVFLLVFMIKNIVQPRQNCRLASICCFLVGCYHLTDISWLHSDLEGQSLNPSAAGTSKLFSIGSRGAQPLATGHGRELLWSQPTSGAVLWSWYLGNAAGEGGDMPVNGCEKQVKKENLQQKKILVCL